MRISFHAIVSILLLAAYAAAAQTPTPSPDLVPTEEVVHPADGEPRPEEDAAGTGDAGRPQTRPGVRAADEVFEDAGGNLIFKTAGSERMRILTSGLVGIGTSSPAGHLGLFSTADGMAALYAHSRPNIEADTTQYDLGTFSAAHASIPTGVTNSGYIMGARSQGFLEGSGTLANTYGLYTRAGVADGSAGHVTRAYGAAIFLTKGSGTMQYGFGLYVNDIPATSGYGVYQLGADDSNYFAGNVGSGMLPVLQLDVRGTASVYDAARRVGRLWDDTAMAQGVGAGMDLLGKYTTAGDYTQFANIKGVKASATSGDAAGNLVLSVSSATGNVHEVVRVAKESIKVTGKLTSPAPSPAAASARTTRTSRSGFRRRRTCRPARWSC